LREQQHPTTELFSTEGVLLGGRLLDQKHPKKQRNFFSWAGRWELRLLWLYMIWGRQEHFETWRAVVSHLWPSLQKAGNISSGDFPALDDGESMALWPYGSESIFLEFVVSQKLIKNS